MKEKDINRTWHDNFKRYTEFIVSAPAYSGLFYERKKDGTIKWVETGKSPKGKLRLHWWNEICNQLGIPLQKGCYARAARAIHPTKMHTCQCCGKELSILYVYPNKVLLKSINKHFSLSITQSDYTIIQIIDTFCNNQNDLNFIASKFNLENGLNADTLKEQISDNFIKNCLKPLSPGVMSNLPDRFDGFHSDGLCCRENTDKGRHSDNMKTYMQDRRAYEDWSDGDYNLANRLMGEFHKGNKTHICPICHKRRKMTADHIGPISLGFRHHIFFAPMYQSCNSSKNNRFTYADIKLLVEFELKGNEVISWHSKYIWDKIKNLIVDDKTAKIASKIMATNHQNILQLFSLIWAATGEEYLKRFLHPEYSLVDYKFKNFDPFDLSKLEISAAELTNKNKLKNQERYIRISFEALEDFSRKDNRRAKSYCQQIWKDIDEIIKIVKNHEYKKADELLLKSIAHLGNLILTNEWFNKL